MKTKIFKSVTLAAVLAFTVSCKDNENEVEASAAQDAATATIEAVTYTVDASNSNIEWVGSKVAGQHNGDISIKSGMVMVNGKSIESGEFTIDMNTIAVTDLKGEEADGLRGHLSSEDFFDVEKFPTATFTVTGVSEKDGKTMLEGNLTMKEQTKNVAFPVTVKYDGDKMMLDSETFTIDRTDWGIKYGSESLADVVKDKAISDDIELKVNLVASK
ncbi:MAG: YceI family protein [Nonlabens sp.]